jgi:putative PIN family toxin of toxin-antitoxin system
MRLVLDTDVVVAALRSPSGASAYLLDEIDSGKSVLLLSVALTLEYEAVCRRPQHRLAAGLNHQGLDEFLNQLIDIAEPVSIGFIWRPLLEDPNDEMVLEAAVNGQADALVTFNRRHYGNAPSRFGIELLSPGEVLWRIRT